MHAVQRGYCNGNTDWSYCERSKLIWVLRGRGIQTSMFNA